MSVMAVTAMHDAAGVRVLVALSGGVDSSVCVQLLREQGYDVECAVLKMTELHTETVEAARAVAEKLDVPLHIVDMQLEFEKNVIQYFINEYQNGSTPNPCIICNPRVKFKALVDTADRLGCDFIATGHYARLNRIKKHDGTEMTQLLRGESLKRDQSYMLYRLSQHELSRLMLPLANFEKSTVREIANKLELPSANKPDSQENCFIIDTDYAAYIEQRCGKSKPGDFIAPDGTVCGRHDGIIHYTVGQRRGLGIALGRPVFVKQIDAESNRIILADLNEVTRVCAAVREVTAISGERFPQKLRADVKIRSTAVPVPATIHTVDERGDRLSVVFDEPQRAVAKGQSLVIYDGDIVLGGGFIE